MEQYKRANVIMLPTEDNHSKFAKYILDSSFGGCIKENELCTTTSTIGWSNIFKPQHLYIISDDEIQKDDCWINLDRNTVNYGDLYKLANNTPSCKKIIATTDNSLLLYDESKFIKNSPTVILLPQLSQQFIEKYIESYNKGEIITDVLVEYHGSFGHYDGDTWYAPKVNPKDNTITIKKLKTSWNREEIIKLLNKLNNTLNIGSDLTLEQWIEENL